MNFSEIFDKIERDRVTSSNDRILIIDGLNTYLRIWASVPIMNENGDHYGGVVGFLRSIGSNIRDYNPSKCIIVFDGKGGSQRRRKLYPEYKMNRKTKMNVKRLDDLFSSAEEEQESMRQQMQRLIEYLETLPIQILCIDNIEADDTIAYISKQCLTNSNIRIVSTDRDFLQLVNHKIEVYNPVKKKLYTPDEIQCELGFNYKNYLLYRIINGDVSDNIRGIDGIGLKTILKHIPQFISDELSIEELLNFASTQASFKKPKKIFKTLVEQQERLHLNYKLMQLSDTDISGHAKLRIFDLLENQIKRTNKLRFKQMLIEDHLHLVFKNPDDWLLNTFNRLDIWTTH